MQELNTIAKNKPNTKILMCTEKTKTNTGKLTFQQEVRLFMQEQRENWKQQREFNKKQLEFNKYVLDVFKRNNLK